MEYIIAAIVGFVIGKILRRGGWFDPDEDDCDGCPGECDKKCHRCCEYDDD